MKNNSALVKELRRELLLIQARRDTEYDLPEELKHKLWLEAKQVDALIDGGRMKSNNNKNLNELHQILQFAVESVCDAVILIGELPPELLQAAISVCKNWITKVQHDFEQFERELI